MSLDLFVLTSFNKYVYLHLEPETYTHKMINNQKSRKVEKKYIEILSIIIAITKTECSASGFEPIQIIFKNFILLAYYFKYMNGWRGNTIQIFDNMVLFLCHSGLCGTNLWVDELSICFFVFIHQEGDLSLRNILTPEQVGDFAI